jgi:hypothetical protein
VYRPRRRLGGEAGTVAVVLKFSGESNILIPKVLFAGICLFIQTFLNKTEQI